MNDPGLDEPIRQDAKIVDEEKQLASDSNNGSDADDADDEQAYLAPSRWWFASTAFPLIAGTFGPMASAFNICAIASYWRTDVEPPQTENTGGNEIPDPKWLLAINGVSLALAIIANLALLFNMARRIPFSIAQPITIIGWYLSGFILVGLVASVHAPSMMLPASDIIFLTQAYYYACLAAGLYIIIASFMVITVYGAYAKHYDKDFQLSMSQRTLMLQTILYLVWLLGGGAVFARIEGWLFLNGVWWANFTLLTIGIGDYSPTTHLGQSLLFPYAFGGIVILGLVVGSIRSLVLERGEKKISARIVEKKREKVIDHLQDGKHSKSIRLGIFHPKKIEINKDDKEYRRRAQEFHLMRKIQDYADTRKKWTALLISALSWLTLWLVGAAVFYVAEQEAQPELTYFEWIYFAYTSLLTIGYGDYTINGNAGKPVFVFWSLLAIPTLTILISNMGDTVVKGIRDATIWAGELTILPGEGSTTQRVKKGAAAVKDGNLKNHIKQRHGRQTENDPVEEPPGGVFLATERRRKDHKVGENGKVKDPVSAATDRLGKGYERDELDAATQAQQRGDRLDQNVHLYHYLLVREIRNVMKDLNEETPKKYSYHEWAWFMRLLGEDEADPKFHKKPERVRKPGKQESDEMGRATEDGDETTPWSWVGIRSPLLGTEEEAEWVLERLSEKLEEELKMQNDRQRQGKEQREPPVTEGSRDQHDDEDEEKDDDDGEKTIRDEQSPQRSAE